MTRDVLIGLRTALAEREVSSREVVTAALAAIEREADLGAFLTLDPEGALAAADVADRRLAAGETAPLLGVPIGVKDLHETAGLRTTYGSVAFRDNVPEEDCILVGRLRAAGAVIVGKTNTPAFGLLGETKNKLAPETRNPCDRSLTTGGSSGGSAAAVAAGLVPVATGTDSAGSITGPSSMCGVFGIKPTLGRIPTWPIPDDSMLFITHGPIASNVADAVTLLEVMAGHDSRDPVARREPLPDLAAELAAADRPSPLAGLRVAWSATLDWFAVDDDVRAITEAAALQIAGLGAEVDEATPQVEHPMELYFPIFGVDTRRGVLPVMDPDEFYPESVEEISRYPALTAEEYVGLLARLWRFRSGLADFFDHYDVLITPATATAAFPVGEPPDRIGGVDVEPGWMSFMPFSSPWNLGTHPTASMPAGVTAAGRPVGAMVVAAPGREDLVVRVAAAFERAQPWPAPPAVST
jgi:Asp-tRNA(Asn)/Glu-tRNA(Gln) amidotransferase A subunit family amidase